MTPEHFFKNIMGTEEERTLKLTLCIPHANTGIFSVTLGDILGCADCEVKELIDEIDRLEKENDNLSEWVSHLSDGHNLCATCPREDS